MTTLTLESKAPCSDLLFRKPPAVFDRDHLLRKSIYELGLEFDALLFAEIDRLHPDRIAIPNVFSGGSLRIDLKGRLRILFSEETLICLPAV